MNFWDDPRLIDQCVYDLVLSNYPRGVNRARILDLANGAPPYSPEEVEENNIQVNVSDLAHTRLIHDARTQYANAFLKTPNFARARLEGGPVHKRSERSAVVTRHWNRCLKRSIRYYERLRAQFGMLVLSGISPGVWENEYGWCPKPLGVEDVLLPGETLLGFDNLPFFVLRRSFTAIELSKLTDRDKRDPGWQMETVEHIQEWLHEQATQLRAQNWPDVWTPEKITERSKEQAGSTLAGDRAPRIEVFDFYAFEDQGNRQGWVRRMILDSWSEPVPAEGGKGYSSSRKEIGESTDGFLYTSRKRLVAPDWRNIVSFQFADLSAKFPAFYNSVRGLGWMLYAACHMGNRMRCKFYESVFESLNPYFEVDDATDVQNALRLNLVSKGFIDKTIRPVKSQDRWQINANLVELGLQDNARIISDNSAAWVQSNNFSRDRTEKTRFQVMAEMQAVTSLVSAAIAQAQQYQIFEQREIFRRFTRPVSKDPEVRSFQARCFEDGVPAKYLHDADAWEIEAEQAVGAGNKTLAMTIAQQLMEWQGKFDPDPQRKILRDAVLAITDDAGLALELVPESPVQINASVHDAELTAASLLTGVPVQVVPGTNHIDAVLTLLRILSLRIDAGLKAGGMVDPKELAGLNALAQHIGEHLKILAQDKSEQERVKQWAAQLGALQNHLRAFAQRLQQAMQKRAQANGNGGLDPKDQARIEAMKLEAQTKVELAKRSHAQRTAQRQIQFEAKLKQDQQQHQADLASKDLETASNIRRNRLSSLRE